MYGCWPRTSASFETALDYLARKQRSGRRCCQSQFAPNPNRKCLSLLTPSKFYTSALAGSPRIQLCECVCVCVQLEKEFVFLSERHRTALTPRCLICVCAFVCFVKIQASISTGRRDSLFLWVDEWVYVHVPQNLTLLCGFRIHTNNQNRTLLGPLNHSLC